MGESKANDTYPGRIYAAVCVSYFAQSFCKKYGITVLSGTGNGKKLKHKKKE
jgi:hypothetical protein